jgi:hypothetical protein
MLHWYCNRSMLSAWWSCQRHDLPQLEPGAVVIHAAHPLRNSHLLMLTLKCSSQCQQILATPPIRYPLTCFPSNCCYPEVVLKAATMRIRRLQNPRSAEKRAIGLCGKSNKAACDKENLHFGVQLSKSLVKASLMVRSWSSTCWGRSQALMMLFVVKRQSRDFFYLLSKWNFFVPQLNLWVMLWSGQITLTLDKSTPLPPYEQPHCDELDRAHQHSAWNAYHFPFFFDRRLLIEA